MSVDIRVPTLGESVTEATVGKWLKQPGDSVKMDEPLVELETDKVTLEVNAPAAGVLGDLAVKPGETVAVGAKLGAIGDGDGAAATSANAKPQKTERERDAKPLPSEQPEQGAGEQIEVEATAEAKPHDGAGAPEPRAANGSAPQAPRPAAAPAAAPSSPSSPQRDMSPAVRRIAAENGIDAGSVAASGPRGHVLKGDVLEALKSNSAMTPAVARAPERPQPQAGDAGREERVRMTKLRQTIARRLKEAQQVAAMLTTFNEVDMSAVMAARAQYKDLFEKKHGTKLGFMGFFVRACIQALKEVPAVNAEIDGEDIVYKNYYHIGVAVGTERGLVVPVLRDADSKSLAEVEAAIAAFGAKARDGKLAIGDMQGGTFTISNGGVYGSLMSTPILNAPQSGILGMHKIEERAIVIKGQVVVRPMMYLALTYDHRIVDGREAVTFLVRVKESLEDPQRLLLGI